MGRDRLLVLEAGSEPREIELDATDLHGLSVAGDVAVAVVADSPVAPDRGRARRPRRWRASSIREARHARRSTLAYLSQPRFVEFPTTDGRTAFAFHYPPTNPDVVAPDGELPPLLVISHGGPTSNGDQRLSLDVQFFTSRGFAVVDVDYGGSSGYGRAYRDRLLGRWGIVDLEDCTNVGDLARLAGARRSGAAGHPGWQRRRLHDALRADLPATMFAAGASYFGVGDLAALARDTHKFESRYLDLLVAPWPDGVAVYDERSPDPLRGPHPDARPRAPGCGRQGRAAGPGG